MLLGGHEGEVFGVKFNPEGTTLASCSHDKHIFLWRVYGECENFMVLKGHKNAVLDVHWTQDGEKLLSASPDKSVRVWDASTGQQTKKMTEHTNFVNSCYPLRRGPPLLCSGSDDASVKVIVGRVSDASHIHSPHLASSAPSCSTLCFCSIRHSSQDACSMMVACHVAALSALTGISHVYKFMSYTCRTALR